MNVILIAVISLGVIAADTSAITPNEITAIRITFIN